MTLDEARQYLTGKFIKDIHFRPAQGLLSGNEIESIELVDGNFIKFSGDYDGEVTASIYYPKDGIEDGITN